jgi:hypothetical protein
MNTQQHTQLISPLVFLEMPGDDQKTLAEFMPSLERFSFDDGIQILVDAGLNALNAFILVDEYWNRNPNTTGAVYKTFA